MISTQFKVELYDVFASEVIKDGSVFVTCLSEHWKLFWNLVFGHAYHIPTRLDISDKLLPKSFDKVVTGCCQKLESFSSLCLSLEDFSNVHPQSVFNAMGAAPIPLNLHKFCLESKRESSVNLNVKLKSVTELCDFL